MKREQVQPTGQEVEVGIDELFFSTTTRQGVIELANSTFVRLSHHSHEELVGSPHNVVRHPDMPGAAFRMVWEQLRTGQPACAYVKNLAGDGSTYWVFTTLLPVGDGYLSVRKRPLIESYRVATEALYAQVRPQELAAREAGASKEEAARLGFEPLREGLAALGMANADDLALTTLPAEMAEHARQTAGLPRRPEARGPLADLLSTMHDIDTQTARSLAHLEEYAQLVAALEASYADAEPATTRLDTIAQAAERSGELPDVNQAARDYTERMIAAATAAGQGDQFGPDALDNIPNPVVELAGAIRGHADAAGLALAELGEHLQITAKHVRWLRMRIALLRLHNTMVGHFAAELLDGCDLGDSTESMKVLCEALREGAEELNVTDAAANEEAAKIPALVEGAVRQADRARRLAVKWRRELDELGCREAAAAEVDVVEAATAEGFDELRRYYDVASRCAMLHDPHDAERLTADVDRMARCVAEYDTRDTAA